MQGGAGGIESRRSARVPAPGAARARPGEGRTRPARPCPHRRTGRGAAGGWGARHPAAVPGRAARPRRWCGPATWTAARRMASSAWMSWRRRAVPRCIIACRGSRRRRRGRRSGGFGRRLQGAGPGLEYAVGQGGCRVAVARLLLEDEQRHGRVVEEHGALQGLAGEGDQPGAELPGREGHVLDRALDHRTELLAGEQPGDQGLVGALGQGRGARRQAGGEAMGDAEPVLAAGRARGWPPSDRASREPCRG